MLPVNINHYSLNSGHRLLCKLTASKLALLENTIVFTPSEKLELLGLFAHTKWIAEVDIGLKNKDLCIQTLDSLAVPWRINQYTKQSGDVIYWLQVGANEAVLEYIEQRRDVLSDIEAGVLYGYPFTAVLGFAEIINAEDSTQKDIVRYRKGLVGQYLSCVHSAEFSTQEITYFNHIWDILDNMSPTIVNEAKHYYELHHVGV